MLLFCPVCSNAVTISRTSPDTTDDLDAYEFTSDGELIKPALPSSSARAATADADDEEEKEGDEDEDAIRRRNRFECRSCPYQFVLYHGWYERKKMKRKEVEDVLGGRSAWDNVDRTEIPCADDACTGTQAFFRQVQIRSADEPMTSFYKCTTCAKEWRD